MESQTGIPMEEPIIEASRGPAKLPVALIWFGVVLTSAVLGLIFFKAPGGILLRLHGNTLGHLYYGVLIAIVIFGLAEVYFGYWVVPRDEVGWHASGKMVLWVSLMALILVLALGGLAFLKFK